MCLKAHGSGPPRACWAFIPTLAAKGSYGDCDEGRLDDGRAEREEPDFPFGLGVHIAQRSGAWIVPQIKIPAGRRTAGPTPNCSLGCRRPSVGGLARPAAAMSALLRRSGHRSLSVTLPKRCQNRTYWPCFFLHFPNRAQPAWTITSIASLP
jgi:hypothetical protein